MFSLFDEKEFITEKFGKKHLKNISGDIEFRNVGFAYYGQWQKDLFLLQTGLGISPHWLTQSIEDEMIEVSMLDTEGIPFTYIGYVEGRTDKTLDEI